MTTKIKFSGMFVLLAVMLSACNWYNSFHHTNGFTASADSTDWRCEVVLPAMHYVRIFPVASPDSLTGMVVIPSTVHYDGEIYVVTQIGANAFQNYTGITTVVLPSTLTTIENNAFRNCTGLTQINTPQPLSTIGDYAFEGCGQLAAFSLNASISSLGTGCFKNCTSLSGLQFPSTFSIIPDEAFYGCSSLTTVQLPPTTTAVGAKAFCRCTGLTSVEMDHSVQSIGDSAFAHCPAITSIKCLTATPPACQPATFAQVPTAIPVTVPMASVGSYQTAQGWNKFSV